MVAAQEDDGPTLQSWQARDLVAQRHWALQTVVAVTMTVTMTMTAREKLEVGRMGQWICPICEGVIGVVDQAGCALYGQQRATNRVLPKGREFLGPQDKRSMEPWRAWGRDGQSFLTGLAVGSSTKDVRRQEPQEPLACYAWDSSVTQSQQVGTLACVFVAHTQQWPGSPGHRQGRAGNSREHQRSRGGNARLRRPRWGLAVSQCSQSINQSLTHPLKLGIGQSHFDELGTAYMYRYRCASSQTPRSIFSPVTPCGCIAGLLLHPPSLFLPPAGHPTRLPLQYHSTVQYCRNQRLERCQQLLCWFPSCPLSAAHCCCVRRDPASSATIYLAFLQVGLEVADLFQDVFPHKTYPGNPIQGTPCTPGTQYTSMRFVIVALAPCSCSLGKPQQPTQDPKRAGMAWAWAWAWLHGRHLSGGPVKSFQAGGNHRRNP